MREGAGWRLHEQNGKHTNGDGSRTPITRSRWTAKHGTTRTVTPASFSTRTAPKTVNRGSPVPRRVAPLERAPWLPVADTDPTLRLPATSVAQ